MAAAMLPPGPLESAVKTRGHQQLAQLRLSVKAALADLERKDTAARAQLGISAFIDRIDGAWELEQLVRDLLAVERCSLQASKYRYRLAAQALQQHGDHHSASRLVELIIKRVVEQSALDKQQTTLEDLGGLVSRLAVTLLDKHPGRDERDKRESYWFSSVLLRPLLRTAAKSPLASKASMIYAVVSKVLEACSDLCNLPAVKHGVEDCLKYALHLATSGQHTQVPESFLPLQQCLSLLRAETKPNIVQLLADKCMQGIACKAAWQARMRAAETVSIMVNSVQVDKHCKARTPCPGVDALSNAKAPLMVAVNSAKFDQIAHVRQAAQHALSALQSVPDPLPELDPGKSGCVSTNSKAKRPISSNLHQKPEPAVPQYPFQRPMLSPREKDQLDFGIQVFSLARPEQPIPLGDHPANYGNVQQSNDGSGATGAVTSKECGTSPASALPSIQNFLGSPPLTAATLPQMRQVQIALLRAADQVGRSMQAASRADTAARSMAGPVHLSQASSTHASTSVLHPDELGPMLKAAFHAAVDDAFSMVAPKPQSADISSGGFAPSDPVKPPPAEAANTKVDQWLNQSSPKELYETGGIDAVLERVPPVTNSPVHTAVSEAYNNKSNPTLVESTAAVSPSSIRHVSWEAYCGSDEGCTTTLEQQPAQELERRPKTPQLAPCEKGMTRTAVQPQEGTTRLAEDYAALPPSLGVEESDLAKLRPPCLDASPPGSPPRPGAKQTPLGVELHDAVAMKGDAIAVMESLDAFVAMQPAGGALDLATIDSMAEEEIRAYLQGSLMAPDFHHTRKHGRGKHLSSNKCQQPALPTAAKSNPMPDDQHAQPGPLSAAESRLPSPERHKPGAQESAQHKSVDVHCNILFGPTAEQRDESRKRAIDRVARLLSGRTASSTGPDSPVLQGCGRSMSPVVRSGQTWHSPVKATPTEAIRPLWLDNVTNENASDIRGSLSLLASSLANSSVPPRQGLAERIKAQAGRDGRRSQHHDCSRFSHAAGNWRQSGKPASGKPQLKDWGIRAGFASLFDSDDFTEATSEDDGEE